MQGTESDPFRNTVEQINQASDAMDATNVPVERSLNPAFKWKELTFMYYNYKQALVSHEQNCRIFAVIAERQARLRDQQDRSRWPNPHPKEDETRQLQDYYRDYSTNSFQPTANMLAQHAQAKNQDTKMERRSEAGMAASGQGGSEVFARRPSRDCNEG